MTQPMASKKHMLEMVWYKGPFTENHLSYNSLATIQNILSTTWQHSNNHPENPIYCSEIHEKTLATP